MFLRRRVTRVEKTLKGELIWYRRQGRIEFALYVPLREALEGVLPEIVSISGTPVPLLSQLQKVHEIYRHPITLHKHVGRWVVDPIFAVLAGNTTFSGSRSDFRDLISMAAQQNLFLYVLPVDHVNSQEIWQGFVRIGYKKWISIPCPRPQAVYNRIPNRVLERSAQSRRAKALLASQGIPMFNPEYFNKASLYKILRNRGLQEYLPVTVEGLFPGIVERLLQRFGTVYLKPVDGSIGQGIMHIEHTSGEFRLRALVKHGVSYDCTCATWSELWRAIQSHRLKGSYVVQQAIDRITWHERPCDFRILTQKDKRNWNIVGIGVRVAGPTSITTHVPNGGSIASGVETLKRAFPENPDSVKMSLEQTAIRCAGAIDEHFQSQLGEMSVDLGVDPSGRVWFFEANAKPMKFDEPVIRQRSLQGVLNYLQELARES
ncbi:YheC/YheD family protein [Alicyclobacillaceae bacterium I2511]|nr:YheC/YheD family protein [Alicyclobacillaceae bacterium I2511]